MPVSDIDDVPLSDVYSMYSGLSAGLYGPRKDYIIGYNQARLQQAQYYAFLQANSGKDFKAPPLSSFDEMFPQANVYFTLGNSQDLVELRREYNAIPVGEGVPEWLIQKKAQIKAEMEKLGG